MDFVTIKLGGKKYEVLVAKTEEEKTEGLQNIESLEDNEGMIFVYDEPQDLDFWMKDTMIPLDIIFIDEDCEVISVKLGKPNSTDYLSEKNAKYVVELNANSGVKKDDVLVLPEDFDEEEHPELEVNKMYIIGSDGKPQAELQGNERIVSRKETRVLIRKAKKASISKNDSDYRALGRYMVKVLDGQDSRDPEYVKSRTRDN